MLYRLDPSTYQAAYDSARAAIAKAEASVQTARRNVERNKELVAIKFVSQQAYDDAVTTLRQNEADLAAAKAATEAARINLAYTNVVAADRGPDRQVGSDSGCAGHRQPADGARDDPADESDVCRHHPVVHRSPSPEAGNGERGVEAGARRRGTRDAATRGRHELSSRGHPAVLRCHGRRIYWRDHAACAVPESRRHSAAQLVCQGSA